MQNRKLIALLKTFSKRELQQLNKFLSSPFFNEQSQLLELFCCLKKYAPDYTHAKLNSRNLFAYIFPDRPFNENALNKLISRLFKLIEEFISFQKFKEQRTDQQLFLLQFYNEKMLDKAFNSTYKKINKSLEKQVQDKKCFYNKWKLENEYATFLSKKDKRTQDINFQAANNALDIHYLVAKLIQLCQMLNRQQSIKIDYQLSLMQELDMYLAENKQYLEVSAIAIWHEALLLLMKQNKKKHYDCLKKLLDTQGEVLLKTHLRVLYTFLENAAKQLYTNRQQYYAELFDLYNMQIEEGIIYQDGYWLPPIFKNIITVALRLQKYDWVEQFIQQQRPKILPTLREEVYNYNLANLRFHQKKYHAALLLLQTVDYQDIFTELAVRRMQLKIYYELDEINLLESAINAFRVFMHRNKLLTIIHKKAHQHYINFIGRLCRLPPHKPERLEMLENDLLRMGRIPEKQWILEKIRSKH